MADNNIDARELEKCLEEAHIMATDMRHEYLTLEHILHSALNFERVRELITEIGADPKAIQQEVSDWLEADNIDITNLRPRKTANVENCIQKCVARVMFGGRTKIEATDVILSIAEEDNDSYARYFLAKAGVTALAVKETLAHGMDDDEEGAEAQGGMMGAGGMGGDPLLQNPEKMTKKRAEKILQKFCINLNEKAKEGDIDPLIGRETEVENTVHTVARRRKNNCIYVGEPGVGKTAIAEGLAKRIVDGSVPDIIKDATVWNLDVGGLIAGTRFRGDFEERMKAVLKALEMQDGQIMLFIDEIHTILGAGAAGGGNMDVSNLLKPALARGTLRCIGSTTLEEYRNTFEKDKALNRRFQRLDIYEPSIADCKRILEGLKEHYEAYHEVEYEIEGLHQAVELTDRYVNDKYLPDKAIDVMDAAGARQRIMPENVRKTSITVKDIEHEVSIIARMPEKNVSEDEKHKIADLENDLKKHVYGQDHAITTLTSAIMVARAGLREPEKPDGNFLFTGPTGTGKTETAKQLAQRLGIHFERFDMSEYMERHSVAKLIGAPPGYVGHDDTNGLLCDAVDSHPHMVLLLDEIEKAHPDIFNTLLQIMDYGKLTNSKGKTVSFRNIILIMTSNVGAREAEKPAMGFVQEESDAAQEYDEAIKTLFSPEFRNRLDEIVTFNKLPLKIVEQVVDKFIKELNDLAQEAGVTITVSSEARKWLAENGYQPSMGARPMARLIHDKVKKPVSVEMLVGKLVGGGTAKVHLEKNDIKVVTEPNAKAVQPEGEPA